MSQNVLIPPNHILLTCTKSIFITCANFSHHLAPTLETLYHLPTLYYFLSINIGSISFSSSSGMDQLHHPVGCHATGIDSLLISFLPALHCLSLFSQAISLKLIIV